MERTLLLFKDIYEDTDAPEWKKLMLNALLILSKAKSYRMMGHTDSYLECIDETIHILKDLHGMLRGRGVWTELLNLIFVLKAEATRSDIGDARKLLEIFLRQPHKHLDGRLQVCVLNLGLALSGPMYVWFESIEIKTLCDNIDKIYPGFARCMNMKPEFGKKPSPRSAMQFSSLYDEATIIVKTCNLEDPAITTVWMFLERLGAVLENAKKYKHVSQ